MKITYTNSIENIKASQLVDFFVGWPNPPQAAMHLKILQQSKYLVLAIDISTQQVVGFINAVSDGILSAYIPLLEVLPNYQKRGIGKVLVEKLLAQMNHLYMIDVACDDDVVAFYEKLGLKKGANLLMIRHYKHQNGEGVKN